MEDPDGKIVSPLCGIGLLFYVSGSYCDCAILIGFPVFDCCLYPFDIFHVFIVVEIAMNSIH